MALGETGRGGVKRRLATVCKWWGQDLARRRCEASAGWAAKLLRLWQEGAAQSVEGKSRVSVLRGLLRDHFVHEAEALFLSAAVREEVTGEPPPLWGLPGRHPQAPAAGGH